MNARSRAVEWSVWGALALVVLSIGLAFLWSNLTPKGPPLERYGQVPSFTLTNQLGQPISLASLRGSIWLADVIFTRCPGPCLHMTRQMKAIQEQLPPGDAVKLVSLTADPEFDSPAVLKEYAAKVKADSSDWHFLTGPKSDIYTLATQGLKLALQENPGTPIDQQFIHSTRFVLIDPSGQLRSVSFDSSEPDLVPSVLRAIQRLQSEKAGS